MKEVCHNCKAGDKPSAPYLIPQITPGGQWQCGYCDAPICPVCGSTPQTERSDDPLCAACRALVRNP